MLPLAADFVEFVFLFNPENSYGIYLARPYYDLLLQYDKARKNAETWGEFKASFGPHALVFVTSFVSSEIGEAIPADDERIEELEDRVWVLYEEDFPLLQCQHETYYFYKEILPDVHGRHLQFTEYFDEPFALYPLESYDEVRTHLESMGHRAIQVCTPNPYVL